MATSTTLQGCCVSRYVTLSKDDTLKTLVRAGVFANGSSVAWCAVDPEVHNKEILEAFLESEIPFQKLGNGQYFFFGGGDKFIEACTMETLRPIIEWEKKEGRKRNEKRVGDIVSLTNYLGGAFEGRVDKILKSGNITVRLSKTANALYYPPNKLYDNYGSGFTQDYFSIVLPLNADGSVKDNDK